MKVDRDRFLARVCRRFNDSVVVDGSLVIASTFAKHSIQACTHGSGEVQHSCAEHTHRRPCTTPTAWASSATEASAPCATRVEAVKIIPRHCPIPATQTLLNIHGFSSSPLRLVQRRRQQERATTRLAFKIPSRLFRHSSSRKPLPPPTSHRQGFIATVAVTLEKDYQNHQ